MENRRACLPFNAGHFSQLLCADPQDPDDNRVAVHYHSRGQNEHYRQLVPREHYP